MRCLRDLSWMQLFLTAKDLRGNGMSGMIRYDEWEGKLQTEQNREEAESMKKARLFLILLTTLCVLLTAAGSGAETYVEANGYRPDQMIYQGSWQSIYSQVLQSHYNLILGYQNRKIEFWRNSTRYNASCLPVGLRDLNGDGIPELYFLETGNNARGDLYIYSANGSTGQCVLFVPGITRLDYDDMLGFEMYLLNSGRLVIKHYKYENEWYLQFTVNGTLPYTMAEYITVEGDYSGEGDDHYYRNGWLISYAEYIAARNALENGAKQWISKYFSSDYMNYGFDYTLQTALNVIGGSGGSATPQPTKANYGQGVYGYTIDKLATRKGPGTQYEGGGTYFVKNEWIKVLSKAWDKRNSIWWVKCEIPYHGEIRVLWTGWKRFDHSTISLDDLPEEVW